MILNCQETIKKYKGALEGVTLTITEGEMLESEKGRPVPGVKSNSKVVIFNNHLAPIYYMHGNIYPNMASMIRL